MGYNNQLECYRRSYCRLEFGLTVGLPIYSGEQCVSNPWTGAGRDRQQSDKKWKYPEHTR